MGTVRDAVIVAAGLPALHHLIFEAKAAGCDRIHIITSPNKDFASLNEDLNQTFPTYSKGNTHLNPLQGVETFFHTQHEQKGLGHAVMMARDNINGPFLVLLGDNILTANHAELSNFKPSSVSKSLVELFERYGRPCVSLYDVGIDRVGDYGIVSLHEGTITSIVEKPSPANAPSTFALCGRFIYGEDTFDLLERYSVEEYGEMQSIELLRHWMKTGELRADLLTNEIAWYDSGLPLEWLKSQVDHALLRPEYRQQFRTWLEKRLD